VTAVVLALATALGACHGAPMPPRYVERVVGPRGPAAGPPPLLVMLHGIGADENDLLPIAGAFDPRLMVVSLRAPQRYHVGYAWFPIDWLPDGRVVPDLAAARAALADLARWMDAAPARLGADGHRVFVLGFSQGAMMALGLLQAIPDRLAGVVALSGRFTEAAFDAPAPVEAVARVPLFVGHGTLDDVLPIANGRAVRDALASRVHDLTYREYPVGHGIAPAEERDVAAWLAERLAP
jgi:phospholipase/carboxylesterase